MQTTLLRRLEPEQLHARGPESLALIERAAEVIGRIADDVSLYGGIESGRITLHRARAPIAALTSGAAERTRAQLARRSCSLHVDVDVDDDGASSVDCDGPRLIRALACLVEVALESTPRGSTLVMSARREPERVRFTVRAPSAEELFAKRTGIVRPSTSAAARPFDLHAALARVISRAHGGHVATRTSERGELELMMTIPARPFTPAA
ncbi:hypothetical protein L6R52_22460 [Myxococcota bacterium]|nr:hypothetical protein [Myxococcota bacterium]